MGGAVAGSKRARPADRADRLADGLAELATDAGAEERIDDDPGPRADENAPYLPALVASS